MKCICIKSFDSFNRYFYEGYKYDYKIVETSSHSYSRWAINRNSNINEESYIIYDNGGNHISITNKEFKLYFKTLGEHRDEIINNIV